MIGAGAVLGDLLLPTRSTRAADGGDNAVRAASPLRVVPDQERERVCRQHAEDGSDLFPAWPLDAA